MRNMFVRSDHDPDHIRVFRLETTNTLIAVSVSHVNLAGQIYCVPAPPSLSLKIFFYKLGQSGMDESV